MRETLVISLRQPAQAYVGPEGAEDAPYQLNGIPCRTGFPPWPAAADLLVTRETMALGGVTYQVPPDCQDMVSRLAAGLDPRWVHLIAGPRESRPLAYRQYAEEPVYLEIRWSQVVPDMILQAQLGGDFWYYRISDIGTDSVDRVVAYGLGDIEELIADHGLTGLVPIAIPPTLMVRKASCE